MQKEEQPSDNVIFLFLIIPVVPAGLVVGSIAVDLWPGLSDAFAALLIVFFLAYLVGIVHALFLGLPAFYLGLRLHAIHWWSCILVGFIIGGLPMTLWMRGTAQVFLAWGFFGASAGFTFWLLWRYWMRGNSQVET